MLPIIAPLLAFAGVSLATTLDFCPPKPASCAAISNEAKEACLSLIAIHKPPMVTCKQPPVISTVTVTTDSPVIIVTSIVSAAETQPTTLVATAYTTPVNTQFVTESVTEVVPVTVSQHVTATNVISVTRVQDPDRCITAAPLARRVKDSIPRDCECFLTKTKGACHAPSTSIKTVTATAAASTQVSVITVSSTVVPTVLQSTLIEIQSTQTDVASVTVPVTNVVTNVVTETAVATVTVETPYNYCQNPRTYSQKPANANQFQLRVGRDTTGPADCCQSCARLANCVYWSISYGGTYCQLFVNTASKGCATAQCSFGRVDLLSGGATEAGTVFGQGACARSYQMAT